jgi:rhodanese-related sulfurtransferase
VKSTVVQAAVLLGTAALCAAALNTWGPRRIPWVQDWTRHIEQLARGKGIAVCTAEGARALLRDGAHTVFDARLPKPYRLSRIPAAVSLPYDRVEETFPHVEPLLDRGAPILVYCAGVECDEGYQLALFLKQYGYTNVTLLAAGFRAWRAAGGAVERGRP